MSAPDAVECPFCGSHDTELLSLFGQQLLTAQFYCRGCRTPFERIKDETVLRHARSQTGPPTIPKSES
jgi:ring-1,2-phenylacetyl-CoA epoxidase subunit PaaD